MIFVSNQRYINPHGGGVQWCTREYLETFVDAGFELSFISYENDNRLSSRLLRKLFPRPFKGLIPPGIIGDIVSLARRNNIQWIVLNNSEAISLAESLRSALPDCRLIYLSHGPEIVDEVNTLRLDPSSSAHRRASFRWLGRSLMAEINIRRSLDATICISPEDQVFEYWLGAQNTLYLPRRISFAPLRTNPVPLRIGTVATLDHAPNLDGIRLLAAHLDRHQVEFRIVGSPSRVGERLQAEFKCITYLGRLDDSELASEAATWMVFVNPIFCQARGASTKVATALGWGLPVLTTPFGARGYNWNHHILPLSHTPSDLAESVLDLLQSKRVEDLMESARVVASLSPTRQASASRLAEFLGNLPRFTRVAC